MAANSYTAVVEKEGDGYVSLCPELDIASQDYFNLGFNTSRS